ncbi:uncharacterized protein LOC116606013 [Nematostella vectensis]|uniref:uncharacterized protein LOC116606013 n=1 Tax=Nematostella vectensis TaxID=45351 RepID=UPI001390460D|nr:uncharacterized protein LOC116606013 [Nematostella vectensis]
MRGYLSLLCLGAHFAASSAIYRSAVIGAEPYNEPELPGGRHPNDDKRYTIQQLNLAARHRNVYFDRAGADPYGIGSPIISSRGKRSVQQYPSMQTYQGYNPNVNQKRDYIAKLNYAARHRNVYLDNVGGDPYGGSSPVINARSRIPHRHGRSLDQEKKKTIKARLGLCKGCCC